MLIGIFQHGHRFQYQRRLEKSHRRRSKTICIQCTAQQAQENECTDQRALVVSATIYYIQIIMLPSINHTNKYLIQHLERF